MCQARRLFLMPFLAALLALSAAPVLALEACETGLSVVTPDGNTGTIVSFEADTCGVVGADGYVSGWPASVLVEAEAESTAEAVPVTAGRYLCAGAEGQVAVHVTVLDAATYANSYDERGGYTLNEDSSVTFNDGPFAGLPGGSQDGVLAFAMTAGAPPLPCNLLAE
ncbi:hypothetical protein [Frigidibacter sp.]|uniref:hypothetical protein n=1 Tax=Frigidibacter sp. TaxID=2586418 RepID=UPI002734DB7F|nr:hypothetical protein [Frigidibacter sp.]MDP3339834.1 hypothetical protein [Frigidibacter sp.]